MVELLANSGDPDQMPHSAASDLGLHCLPVTLLGVSNGLMVNCADPDQLDSSEAKWSGSTQFAKARYIRVQYDKG